MKSVGAYEAKTHLSELLDEASRGARISITRKGVPVAMIVPPSSLRKEDIAETIRKLKESRKGLSLGKTSVRELIEDSRVSEKRGKKPAGASLAALAGGWSGKEAREFDEAVRVFEEIDEGMWK